jgi:O-antigen/teichoic acid export membrane protein
VKKESRPLVVDAGLLAVAQYGATAIGFVTSVIEARFLGPTGYGVAALVIAYPTLLWSFAAVKSIAVTTRYVAIFRATGRTEEISGICKLGYMVDFSAALVAFVLVSATGWWAAQMFSVESRFFPLMVAYAASLPLFSLTGTSMAVLSAWQRFGWLAAMYLFDKVVVIGAVLGLFLAGFGVGGMVIGIAVGQAVSGLAALMVATHVLRREGCGWWWQGSLQASKTLRQELWASFGWSYVAVTLSGLLMQVPLMLLGRLRGPEEAGFYRLATSLTVVGSYIEVALSRVVYPKLSAQWGMGERNNLPQVLHYWTLRGGLPVGALVLLTVPLLPLLVPVMFGPHYQPMIFGTQLLLIGAAISAIVFWVNAVYYAAGRFAVWTQGSAFYILCVLALTVPCIQQWGFSGVAGLVAAGKVLFTLVMAGACLSMWEKFSWNMERGTRSHL